MTHSLKYWIWLSSIPGMGSKRYRQLLEFYGTPENLWNEKKNTLSKVPFLTDAMVQKLTDGKLRENVESHIENIYKYDIQVINIEHKDYPTYLKAIYDPPIVLYVRGTLTKDKCIAVVGSRKATPYGLDMAKSISYELALRGVTVVSGMARGIDSYAHTGALKAKGNTVAVLGCGPDIVYPPENRILMENIIGSGAIISEFLPGFPPLPQNFPARNRIISGMCVGVVVIEANEKSGSLITANFALEQGREVFAVPGNLTSSNSKGTNKLIKDGAKMVTDIEDILEELRHFETYCDDSNSFTIGNKKFNSMYIDLNEEEKLVVECLGTEPLHIDNIVNKSGLNIQTINAILVMLELQGIVEQYPGKLFKLSN